MRRKIAELALWCGVAALAVYFAIAIYYTYAVPHGPAGGP